MNITEISDNSWSGILKVQNEAYTEVAPEDISVLKSKWLTSPDTCFTYNSDNNEVVGYLIAHSWNSEEPPKLYEELPTNTVGPILYIHDLAISTESKNLGVAKQLINKLFKTIQNKGYEKILLVAVQNSGSYWAGFGFKQIYNAPICASYGSAATVMYRALPVG